MASADLIRCWIQGLLTAIGYPSVNVQVNVPGSRISYIGYGRTSQSEFIKHGDDSSQWLARFEVVNESWIE